LQARRNGRCAKIANGYLNRQIDDLLPSADVQAEPPGDLA
jgi:hypothetical protein